MKLVDYLKEFYPYHAHPHYNVSAFARDNNMTRQNAAERVKKDNYHVIHIDDVLTLVLESRPLVIDKTRWQEILKD